MSKKNNKDFMDKTFKDEEVKKEDDKNIKEDKKNIEVEETNIQEDNSSEKNDVCDLKKDKKSSIFKKHKKSKEEEKIDELNDKLKRQMAEFENFRKRTEKEKDSMFSLGEKTTLEKILPIIDNFERALMVDTTDEPFKEGISMIYKMLMKNLKEMGVTEIEAVGTTFNPEFHNAVMHIDDDNYKENEIVEELQKGYMYREVVLRHSMVKVAN